MATPEERKRDRPGVIAHPPFIYLGFLAIGIVLGFVWPLPIVDGALSTRERLALAVLLAASGAALLGVGISQFRKRETHFRTDRPSTAVITDGLYSVSRNPLYIALTLIYVGLSLAMNNLWALALIVAVLVTVRYGVFAREEAYLERKFGEVYLGYKRRVRRWL